MIQPNLASTLSQIIYQEMLQEAEAERRYRQMKRPSPRLRAQMGDLLIAVGRKIGGNVQPAISNAAR